MDRPGDCRILRGFVRVCGCFTDFRPDSLLLLSLTFFSSSSFSSTVGVPRGWKGVPSSSTTGRPPSTVARPLPSHEAAHGRGRRGGPRHPGVTPGQRARVCSPGRETSSPVVVTVRPGTVVGGVGHPCLEDSSLERSRTTRSPQVTVGPVLSCPTCHPLTGRGEGKMGVKGPYGSYLHFRPCRVPVGTFLE